MNLERIHPSLKEQFCEQLYSKHIVVASDRLLKYEEYATIINAKMPVSCYTNFRDSLFHFRKLVSLMEISEIENQAFVIKEHLSRALTDASNSILYHLSIVAEKLLRDGDISDSLKRDIRKSLHSIKKAILRKRFSGMMISNDNTFNIRHEEIQILIENLYELLSNGCAEKFARYSHCQENGNES